MLTGKDLILATKPFAREIRSRSWFYTLSTLALLTAAIVGTVVVTEWYFRLPASIVAGLLIVRMFIIYHDHQHHSILTRSHVADVIMKAFGLFILSPSSIWKRSHDHHHNHNSKLFSASIGSYPISTKKKFLEMDKGERFAYLAVRHPLTIFAGYLSMFIYGMCIRSFASNPKKHMDSLVALILHAIMYAAVIYFFGFSTLLFAIIIPFAIACGLGAYLFYAQHNFPGVTFSDNKEWTYERAALESSSYMKMNPVMDWFTGYIVHRLYWLPSCASPEC
jgi:acyl-lipid omega-6 desaturase (Delta-12 desaturase)